MSGQVAIDLGLSLAILALCVANLAQYVINARLERRLRKLEEKR